MKINLIEKTKEAITKFVEFKLYCHRIKLGIDHRHYWSVISLLWVNKHTASKNPNCSLILMNLFLHVEFGVIVCFLDLSDNNLYRFKYVYTVKIRFWIRFNPFCITLFIVLCNHLIYFLWFLGCLTLRP